MDQHRAKMVLQLQAALRQARAARRVAVERGLWQRATVEAGFIATLKQRLDDLGAEETNLDEEPDEEPTRRDAGRYPGAGAGLGA
jgi:hypothetical protein